MKAKHRKVLDMTPEQLAEMAQWLTYKAVEHIIGKSRYTVHRLVKDGTLEKIGNSASARISLKSVLAYIEQQRGIAEVARTVPNATAQKAAAWAREKAAEQKLARAVEIVSEGTAQAEPEPASNEVIWVEVRQPDGSIREVGLQGTDEHGRTAQERADALRATQRSRWSMVRMASTPEQQPGDVAKAVARCGLMEHWPTA